MARTFSHGSPTAKQPVDPKRAAYLRALPDLTNGRLATWITCGFQRDERRIETYKERGLTAQDCLALRLIGLAFDAPGLEAYSVRFGKPVPRGSDRMEMLRKRLVGLLLYLRDWRPDVLYRANLLWPTPRQAFASWARGPLALALTGDVSPRSEVLRHQYAAIFDSFTSEEAKENAMSLGQELLAESRVELLEDIADEEGDVDPYELEDAASAAEMECPTPGLDYLNWPIYRGRYSPSPDRVRDALDKGARRLLQERKAIAERLEAARQARSLRENAERGRAERKRLIKAFRTLSPTIAIDSVGRAVLHLNAWNRIRANPDLAKMPKKPIGDRVAADRFHGVTHSQVRRGRERYQKAIEAALTP